MTPSASCGRERLQKVLVDLGRHPDRSTRRAEAGPAAAEPSATRDGAGHSQAPDPERLVELTERLERIERKLSDLAEPLDGSPDRFRRWIDGGYWEHIRFSEFLRLKK